MGNFIIPTDGLVEKFQQQFQNLKNDIANPNVLILGQTGVGKSSLINCIFGKELAKVSDVKPETRGFHKFSDPNVSVSIIDSEGYELAKADDFKNAINEYIDANFMNLKEQIHLAWYCISLSSARVLPFDIENIKFLLEKRIPTCVVFTQCDNDTPEGSIALQMGEVVSNKFGGEVPYFQTCNDKEINKDLDLDKLVKWSIDNLNDENLKLGFVMAQKADIEAKQAQISTRIKWYGFGAAAIGGSPIPVSDAVLLTGLQVKMASDIFSYYGLDSRVAELLKNVIGSQLVSMLGKLIAGNLIKMIPVLGQIGGAVINATVATSITMSMGYALNILTRKVVENCLENGLAITAELINSVFTEENLQYYIDQYKKNKGNKD